MKYLIDKRLVKTWVNFSLKIKKIIYLTHKNLEPFLT